MPRGSNGPDRVEEEKSTTKFPEGGTRAWMVVLGAFCVSFSTFGYMNAFGYAVNSSCREKRDLTDGWHRVYQEYYTEHFLAHESSSNISWIGSVQACFLFSGSLIGGPLFDRYGALVRA